MRLVRRSGSGKFNNYLLFNSDFVNKKLKIYIETIKSNHQEKSSFLDHKKIEIFDLTKIYNLSKIYNQILKTELELWNKT